MIQTVIAAVVAFISTNIDDMFIDMLFFAQAKNSRDNHAIFAGKYLGTGLIVAVSCVGAYGLQVIAGKYLWLLGFVPMALGIKEIIADIKGDDDDGDSMNFSKGLAVNTAVVTIANSADNIGVYIPLFAGFNGVQMIIMAVVFAVMTGLWCLLAQRLTKLPAVDAVLNRYKKVIVPAVYILLGLYIIMG